MLVTLEHGPMFGSQRHVVRNETTMLLCDLGFLSIVEEAKPKPKPAFPEWSICTTPTTGVHYIRHVLGAETIIFDGDVSRVKVVFPNCPDSVVSDFRNLREFRKPLVPESIWGDQGK
ncbi:MAG: hypothetical protein ACLPTQ_19920 [Terriglobales bacterium]